MVVLRWLVRLVVALVVLVAIVFFGARLKDGPLGPIPGGPLASGELVTTPVSDWSFATDIEEVEQQLAAQNTSRTTRIVVHDRRAYIPCSLEFPPGKSWHEAALEDGRAIVRIAGRRYPVTLTKVDDAAVTDAARAAGAKKYPAPPSGEFWVFEAVSRTP
jgi:hypothetical protein